MWLKTYLDVYILLNLDVSDAVLALPVESRPVQIQPVPQVVLENPHPVVSVAGPVVDKVPAIPEQKGEQFSYLKMLSETNRFVFFFFVHFFR